MNFKEAYKKANDEIKGDRALLEGILNTQAKEKSKITPMVYKYASLAAAIVLVGAVILMPALGDKFVTEESFGAGNAEETAYTVSESPAEEKAEETKEVKSEEMKALNATMDNVKAEDDVFFDTEETAKNKSVKTEDKVEKAPAEPEAINEDGLTEETTEAVAPMMMRTMPEPSAEAEAQSEETSDASVNIGSENEPLVMAASLDEAVDEGIASGGGSSAAGKMTVPKTASEEKKTDAREIISLAGINPSSLSYEGMTINLSTNLAEFSKDGSLADYEIAAFLENGDKKINVLITSSVTPLGFTLTEEDGKITASKTLGNTDIFVTAYNMTKEEIEGYINSVA